MKQTRTVQEMVGEGIRVGLHVLRKGDYVLRKGARKCSYENVVRIGKEQVLKKTITASY